MSFDASNSKISLSLIGYGKLGKQIEEYALEKGHVIVCKIRKNTALEHLEKADVIIDVSHKDGIIKRVEKALHLQKPLIIGTTGWEDEIDSVKEMVKAANGTVLYTPNFSMGVFFFTKIVEAAAKWHALFPEYDVGGIEIHHHQKLDSPSGTAKKLSSLFSKPLPFSSLRLGNFSGTHTLVFDGLCDTITLTHEAHSRKGFAVGAVACAEWIVGKKGWLTHEDMFRTLHITHHPI